MKSENKYIDNLDIESIKADRDPDAILLSALEILDEAPKKAQQEILEAAEKGQHRAEYMVATFYMTESFTVEEGEDVGEVILYWLKRAAEGGVAEAQYTLGEIYLEDEFPDKSVEIALSWLEKAAEQGNEDAIQKLSELPTPTVEDKSPAATIRRCVNCGIELEDDARFCGECGTKQPELQKSCSNCGAEIQPNAKFCMECGTPIRDNESTTFPSETATPLPQTDSEVWVTQPDKSTITIIIKGVPFNLKLVRGSAYGTDQEIVDFFIGETPVTQALWLTLTGTNPSYDNEDINFPVTNISLSLATAFLIKLQNLTGIKFELPTKEQWNFAYKGGTKSRGLKFSGSNELAEVAWTDGKLHPVGELFANELGLTDMDGNVEELLKDGTTTLITSNRKKGLKDINLAGLRIVVNIPINDKIESGSQLQNIIGVHQEEIIKERNEAIRLIEEAEAKRKREKERAAEEAKRKAEEKARIKLEEEARKKAEKEESRQKRAKLKAEEEERERVAKEARIKELEPLLPNLKNNEQAAEAKLIELKKQIAEKRQKISAIKSDLNACKRAIDKVTGNINELEHRFCVILTQRVKSGLFNKKGEIFDAKLSAITGATKEQLNIWYQELNKNKQVIITDKLDQKEAFEIVNSIRFAGGNAELHSAITEQDAQKKQNEYNDIISQNEIEQKSLEQLYNMLNSELLELLSNEEEAQKKYDYANLELRKCELELDYLTSNKSVKNFLNDKFSNIKNHVALAAIFGKDYEEVATTAADDRSWKLREDNGKFGLVDRFGTWRIEPKFDKFKRYSSNPFFRNGLCAACIDNKWGYIDRDGKWVIKPQFNDCEPWREKEEFGPAKKKYKKKYMWGRVFRNGEWEEAEDQTAFILSGL